MTTFLALLARDLRLSLRHGSDTLAALLFFLIAAALFPLAIGPAPETLGRIAPGIVWVCALLAALLPLDRLFGADLDDGSLDLLLLSGLPASAVAAAKALAHWLVTGVPLLLAAGPLAVMLRMPAEAILVLVLGLLPGTIVLSLLGTAGAALVLGARRGGVLLPLLYPDPDFPAALHKSRHRHAAGFNLPVGNPSRLQHLQPKIAKGQRAAAPRLASHAPA